MENKSINWQAIHAAHAEYSGKLGASQPPMPQPQQHSPMERMMIHAMAMTPNQDGETHGTMVLRALTDHLKRVTPDVNSIHKPPTQPTQHP